MNTGEHASTIDVNEYDLYTPENCPAPWGISKYRTQFLKALADATPEVLETLREDVFPLVAELGVFDGPDSRSERADQILDQHVVAWGKQFNLNDPWLHGAAKLTLHFWRTDPQAADALLWASPPDTPSQVLLHAERQMNFEPPAWCAETEYWRNTRNARKNGLTSR